MTTVTPRSQVAREARKRDIERHLLEGTERLMGDGARFTELSVDRLATAGGISRATFYVYFDDKSHLLQQLAAHAMNDLADAARVWWSSASRRDPADLVAAMAGIISGYRTHRLVIGAVVEMSAYDAAVGSFYRQLLDGIIAELTDVLLGERASGTLRASVDPVITATAMTWMVERTCVQQVPRSTPADDPALAHNLAEIIWGAMYLEPLPPYGPTTLSSTTPN
ncbi:TetR/AcrR family transcriptional regulator [Williamsia sterculiae]|uniref:Transcriptional regulator, TetR family n=1 Tax=Williamsia sterculiae TaxID=1344003 RepID=A0A1N7HAC6_9NOCA|nr:TetR/AcrR family transcriptional regulator [Williamsia sterculiae]SIS21650.1 transcriptional regulator, TetR family [Williamsia sterculiae]